MTQYREEKIYTTQGHCHCDSLTMQRCALLPNNCPSGAFFSQISTSEVPEQLGAPVRRGGGSAVGDQTELHSETDHPNHHHKNCPQWPDTVYYHSYTTPYMGWKIHVIDSFRCLTLTNDNVIVSIVNLIFKLQLFRKRPSFGNRATRPRILLAISLPFLLLLSLR